MKPHFLTLALLAITATSSYAQGTIHFNNGPFTRFQLDRATGVVSNIPPSTQLNFGFFWGTTSQTLSRDPVLPLGTMTTSPGVMSAPNGTAYPIPDTQPGQIIYGRVRGWSASFGQDWRAAYRAFQCDNGGVLYAETDIRQLEPLGTISGPGTIIWQSATGTNPNRFNPMFFFERLGPGPGAGCTNITLPLPPGFSLLANHLNDLGIGINSLNQMLPFVPVETQLLTFFNNDYHVDVFDGSIWLGNATGNRSTTTIEPGKGFFVFNPTSETESLTFTGQVPRGSTLTVSFPPGFKLVGSICPAPVSLTVANGFPQVPEMQVWRYIRAGQPGGPGYRRCVNDGSGWLDDETGEPTDCTISVGEGFFLFNPSTTTYNWTRAGCGP